MVDLTLAVQAAEVVALGIMGPAGGMLARRGLTSVEKWLHLRLSQQQEATVLRAVDTGVGLLRIKLAAGTMQTDRVDLNLGSDHLDAAANVAMALIYAGAQSSKVTKDDLSHMILAGLGHVLGEDPAVPTVGAPPSAVPGLAAPAALPAPIAAAPAPALTPAPAPAPRQPVAPFVAPPAPPAPPRPLAMMAAAPIPAAAPAVIGAESTAEPASGAA